MSEWGAIEKGGEAVSAWEFRSHYLTYGEKYEEFFCPFCDIRLVAYLIYTEGEISKSPHFAARSEKHLFGCDGNPVGVSALEYKLPKSRYCPRNMHAPEMLIDRRPPRTPYSKPSESGMKHPSSSDVSERRQNASFLGKAIPRTHLLQSIVEVHNIVIREIYKQAIERKWSDAKRNDEINKALGTLPLQLKDKTNYRDAFRRTLFLNWLYPRIYHGYGFVEISQEGTYFIQSHTDGKVKGEYKPFKIMVFTDVGYESPNSHLALLKQIINLAKNKQECRWYAYGKPEVQSDAIIVTIQNLDHIYLKIKFHQ
ncbi:MULTISPECIES: hypothetical protein [Thiothrix]|jgi:hypothetical protein|uniref:hypothetical protein n=1 Tax=Thiothrix TaxID=1030 RepID=UPI002580E05C|nr:MULTISPECIES: hypothetical protein [Thiothrix]MDX9987380.1 hypothetical protein [Thiothrix unzii]